METIVWILPMFPTENIQCTRSYPYENHVYSERVKRRLACIGRVVYGNSWRERRDAGGRKSSRRRPSLSAGKRWAHETCKVTLETRAGNFNGLFNAFYGIIVASVRPLDVMVNVFMYLFLNLFYRLFLFSGVFNWFVIFGNELFLKSIKYIFFCNYYRRIMTFSS